MILAPEQRNHFLENFQSICSEENFGRSTWTIDLCYLLKRFNRRHVYYTTTIGVNPNFDHLNYYSRILSVDEKRVNQRFEKANSSGISVEETSISDSTIINHLGKYGPIIVLVNCSLLSCDVCNRKSLSILNDFK